MRVGVTVALAGVAVPGCGALCRVSWVLTPGPEPQSDPDPRPAHTAPPRRHAIAPRCQPARTLWVLQILQIFPSHTNILQVLDLVYILQCENCKFEWGCRIIRQLEVISGSQAVIRLMTSCVRAGECGRYHDAGGQTANKRTN